MIRLAVLVIGIVAIVYIPNQNMETKVVPEKKEENLAQKIWVDSVAQQLTQDEKIGQLFMIRAHSDKGPDHIAQVEKLIREYHVGGLLFFQGTPQKQAELTNKYQALSKRPLMIAMDAEWGLGMRLPKQTISYPKQLMLGAIKDNRLIYDMGQEVARQCRRLGVHVNFAPVADVNNNPDNPVINERSFGEDRHNVTAKSYMYMKGMQDGKVMACAKHFPGHGDTNTDSHYDLPVIKHNFNRLDSIELYPFKVLAQHGIQSMMVAHLAIPAIDNALNTPSTLSSKTVRDLLKTRMGFEGLIFTDGLEMAGVTKHHKAGQLEVKALKAGNDILLLPQNVPAAYKAIKAALESGKLSKEELDISVNKILNAKYKLGLHQPQRVATSNLENELNSKRGKELKRVLVENAITVVRNDDNILPFKNLNKINIGALAIGRTTAPEFQKILSNYGPLNTLQTGKEISASQSKALRSQLKNKDVVVVSLHGMSSSSRKQFGVSSSARNFINQLSAETKVILVLFGNPYALKYFDNINNIVVSYNSWDMTQRATAEGLFGCIKMKGHLPVTASRKSHFGAGVVTPMLQRIRYDLPESVGMNADTLALIEEIANEAISIKATPGCQVLVAKDNKIVYNKAFGHFTYAKKRSVKTSDIYDLASVTKVAATTLSIMKLQEEGKIDINQPFSKYLPFLKGSNKSQLKIRDIMAHHAQLKSWIPFYKETMTKGKRKRPSTRHYSKVKKGKFSVKVTDNLYIDSNYVKIIYQEIKDSDLRTKSGYKYSDLGFILFGKMIKDLTGQDLATYTQKNFYEPLGLKTLTFNPCDKHSKANIPPSEKDNYFRNETVKGNVHDMACAMMGGVSGHAGLFGNAEDLAVVYQMLLNNGYYGGQHFLRPETIRQFTQKYERSTRRAIGFDMLETDPARTQNISSLASKRTFGHTGFTGIGAWADPEHNVIFIFISNRSYPKSTNWKLNKEDIRIRMHDVVYRAMGKRS